MVKLAWIKLRAAVEPVTLGALGHAYQAWAVIQSESLAEDFIEQVDHRRVGQHLSEWVAPGLLKGERVLSEFPAARSTCKIRMPLG